MDSSPPSDRSIPSSLPCAQTASQISPTPNPRITALENEISSLQDQFNGRDPDQILKDHIDLLHRYNEIKDGTQALIARYALIKNKTVRAVHEELDLPLKD